MIRISYYKNNRNNIENVIICNFHKILTILDIIGACAFIYNFKSSMKCIYFSNIVYNFNRFHRFLDYEPSPSYYTHIP